MDGSINYLELKALARRADRARGEERKRLVERLIRELPKLNSFEGCDESTVWLARLIARMKWAEINEFT
ncbi:hypothetical protein ES706_04831 [subsurface metagenome]|nr:hypothetical protein [Hadesarchaea archaeon]